MRLPENRPAPFVKQCFYKKSILVNFIKEDNIKLIYLPCKMESDLKCRRFICEEILILNICFVKYSRIAKNKHYNGRERRNYFN